MFLFKGQILNHLFKLATVADYRTSHWISIICVSEISLVGIAIFLLDGWYGDVFSYLVLKI